MLQSLRSRLVLTTLSITLLGFMVVVVVFTQSLPRLSSQEKQRELQAQAHRFAGLVTSLYQERGTHSELQGEIEQASQVLHERIIVTDPTGRKAVFDSARTTPFYKSYNPSLSPNDFGGGHTVTQFLPHNVVVLKSLIKGTHGHRYGGIVLLVAQAADLQSPLSTVRDITLIAALAALAVWLLIGLFVTYYVFRPLLRITEATRRMARGDYSARVRARGHGELAQLASGFNEMAHQVQASDRTLKDFLGNVSHDLRTPLTMIAGFSQALLDGTAGPNEARASAEVIHEEAIKMQHLVADLTQLTRLESGLLTLDRHPTALRTVAQSAIDHVLRVNGRDDGALLQNHVPSDLSPGFVDAERLERALRNLLVNSIRYTPANGKVTVDAREASARWIEIRVSDTGSGIRPQDVPRVFERFYRADKSRERGRGHSGLGLAIVREIVEAHGGRVDVESEHGRGTTFRLTVPIASVQMGRDGTVADTLRTVSSR
ncbi:MAG: sensor histidine kinase [Chloroflexota bacterium]|nr:MAG: hypothetical protein DLM70_12895 [Chloroflexota bacterium]